jgi:membrane protease YdiL (CAAX protease family)
VTSLRGAACLLAGVWCVLAGGLALSGRSGSAGHDAGLVATFALATWLVWSATPRRDDDTRRARHPLAAGALAFSAGIAVFPSWLRLCFQFGLALGLSPADLALLVPPRDGGLVLVGVLALAPLFEEKLYRGHLLGALRPRLGAPLAILITSALFAVSHLVPWTMAGVFLFGLVLGGLRCGGASLALCIGLHAGVNTAAVICGIPAVRWALPLGQSAALGVTILATSWVVDRHPARARFPWSASARLVSSRPSSSAGTATHCAGVQSP